MSSLRRGVFAAAAFAASGLLAVACGSSSTNASSTTTTKAAAPATIDARTTEAGSVVVDATGRTLYRFDHDMAGSGTSACTGGCAATWPAATVTGSPVAGRGVAGTIGVITRTDGSQQVTLDGHPLYRFSGDQAPGDTKGDGIGGIWHVVPAGATTAASTATTGGGTYGY